MSLKDRIATDRHRVFMNRDHFAEEHSWNSVPFVCVTDDEEALKRKNNNVNDISWDNNTIDATLYVPAEDFPGRPLPNEYGYFDGRYMKILQVQDDYGMLTIVLTTASPKAVTGIL